jgi:hypothetical protein
MFRAVFEDLPHVAEIGSWHVQCRRRAASEGARPRRNQNETRPPARRPCFRPPRQRVLKFPRLPAVPFLIYCCLHSTPTCACVRKCLPRRGRCITTERYFTVHLRPLHLNRLTVQPRPVYQSGGSPAPHLCFKTLLYRRPGLSGDPSGGSGRRLGYHGRWGRHQTSDISRQVMQSSIDQVQGYRPH